MLDTIWEYVNGPDAEVPLMLGMISLAGILLTRIEAVSGATYSETLQELALRYGPT